MKKITLLFTSVIALASCTHKPITELPTPSNLPAAIEPTIIGKWETNSPLPLTVVFSDGYMHWNESSYIPSHHYTSSSDTVYYLHTADMSKSPEYTYRVSANNDTLYLTAINIMSISTVILNRVN